MRHLAILLAAITLCTVGAHANETDPNDIVRKLAPMVYLPEHRGNSRPSIDLEVRFRAGSDHLTTPARALLDRLARALADERLATSRFEVAGHTDASGGRAFNQRLSERRATSVVAYLVRNHGIDPARLIAIGKGEDTLKYPLDPFSAANRRVEIVNLTPVLPSAVTTQESTTGKANDILLGK